MTQILKAGFQTPDGKIFDTKAEALDYLRRPQQEAALNKVTGNNAELTAWLIENEDSIGGTFESTKIRRVTKSEQKQLDKALEAIKASGEKAYSFIIDHMEAVSSSFRWPSVKRGTEEEQAATIKAGFMAMTENNEELVDWIVANKDAILEAFQAGIIKKQVDPKAAAGLQAFRERRAAEKAAAEAAK
jgi:hypothetical protein